MRNLDFIIVGAQKCATTTLHHYLAEHEQIHLPENKEAPFFNQSHDDAQAFNEFMMSTYGVEQLQDSALLGKASPQYMSSPCIPARIKQMNPQVKIVAILRNPMHRALSHYRMAVKRGTETGSYEDAIQTALSQRSLGRARIENAPMHQQGFESESDCYVAWGEYGRILQNYWHEFGPENLLVLFTEDMEINPQATLDKLLVFLGLDAGWQPKSMGQRFHKGGGVPRISPEHFKSLARMPVLGNCYRALPESFRQGLRSWVHQLNLRKDNTKHSLSPKIRAQLQELYRRDLVLLQKMGLDVPWRHAFESAQ